MKRFHASMEILLAVLPLCVGKHDSGPREEEWNGLAAFLSLPRDFDWAVYDSYLAFSDTRNESLRVMMTY